MDNGPTGHAAELARCLDDAFGPMPAGFVSELISGHGNVGFGRGYNLALQRAQSYWHLILNPDAELVSDPMVRGIEHLRQGISFVLVVGWTVGPAGRFQPLCKRHPSVRVLALRALGLRRFRHMLDAYDVQPHPEEVLTDVIVALVSASFMLARTAALKARKGWHPRWMFAVSAARFFQRHGWQ